VAFNFNNETAGVAVIREVKRYVDSVRKEMSVDKAILFGSYAKGTADKLSDVDIAFFVRDFGEKTRSEISVKLLRMTHGYNAYLEPLVFKSTEITRDNPFVNEILRTGQEI
jgi:predicted nucleotidyltransferase